MFFKSRPRRKRWVTSYAEALEVRALPATAAFSVTLQAGVLRIVGTELRDAVVVSQTANDVDVFHNGNHQHFNPADVDSVFADLGWGRDRFEAAELSIPVVVHGGPGKDVLVGGHAADHLFGGSGKDVLDGNCGPDVLDGGRGKDVIFAGPLDAVLDAGRNRIFLDDEDDCDDDGGLPNEPPLVPPTGPNPPTVNLFPAAQGIYNVVGWSVEASSSVTVYAVTVRGSATGVSAMEMWRSAVDVNNVDIFVQSTMTLNADGSRTFTFATPFSFSAGLLKGQLRVDFTGVAPVDFDLVGVHLSGSGIVRWTDDLDLFP